MMRSWYGWENMMDWSNPWIGTGIGIFAVWSAIWTGLALWNAAKNDEKYWFIAFLFIHTAGILEMLYLFVFAKNKLVLTSQTKAKSKRK